MALKQSAYLVQKPRPSNLPMPSVSAMCFHPCEMVDRGLARTPIPVSTMSEACSGMVSGGDQLKHQGVCRFVSSMQASIPPESVPKHARASMSPDTPSPRLSG